MSEPKQDARIDPGAVQLPFVINIHAQFVSEEVKRPTTAYAPFIEIALQSIVALLFNRGERSRQLLRGYVEAIDNRLRPDAKPTSSRIDEMIWDLSDTYGPHSAYVLTPLDAELRRILEGTPHPLQIGYWSLQHHDLPAVRIRCDTFEFQEGSWKGIISGVAQGTTMFLSLLCTPQAKEMYDHHVIDQHMSSIYANERCKTDATLVFKASDLLETTAPEFNFKSPRAVSERTEAAGVLSTTRDRFRRPSSRDNRRRVW